MARKLKPDNELRTHPWRECPLGQHRRIKHPQSAYKREDGTPVSGSKHRKTCVNNKSQLDQLYPEEMLKMAEKFFGGLSGPPKADDLDYKGGNDYDDLIRGWTRYWNDIMEPVEPLDPDLVKALIATESSFKPGESIGVSKKISKKAGRARGLMQLTDQTLEILKDEKGEIKDHLVNLDRPDTSDPCLNIAAGVRWLFRKKETASAKLGEEASWIWTVAEYKSYFKDFKKDPNHDQMNKFISLYERLKKK